MSAEPKYPWRLGTNERYREVVRTVMGLAAASLLLPVFFAREFLGIEKEIALKTVFGASVLWSWGLLCLSVFSGIVFHYLSGKWVRIAWGKTVEILGCSVSESFVEKSLEGCFWITALTFVAGLALITVFLGTYAAQL